MKSLSRVWLFETPWTIAYSSLDGILQARVLDWVAISFSRGSSWPRDWTRVSRIPGRRFNLWATREALNQIPNDYTLEVTNRTKGLDMIDKYLRTMHEGSWHWPSSGERNAKRQSGCLRRPYKQLRKEEKWKAKGERKDIPIWMQSSKEKQGEIRKPSSVINAKK